ncbi:MAG TPA: hypothetical protein PLB97_02485 [Accumulibacter sp.]|nr:hypothetical protein [Accumulibacter sp.]
MITFHITPAYRPRSLVALLFSLLFSLLTTASASADPAGRVGRLSWLSGTVTLKSHDSDDSTAMLNWPLTTGHRLITGPDGRAEVQIGSTMLQLASRSAVEFVQVDDERVRLHLLDGSLTARLYAPESVHEFEIVTRDGSFQPLTAGFFRVDVDRLSSAVTAYSGRLRFLAFDQMVTVDSGQRAQLWYDGRTQHRFLLPENDEFSRWAAVRDQQYGSPLQARYVSAEMTGASYLDAYGRWYDSPEYGAVWFPQTVATDWAPYRDGRWAWISPWGWTWIGVEAWGFAPFHYGRWVYYHNAWGWVPGQRVHRPVYAPALVAWTGTPGNVAAPIGWFPLAPREIYRPTYQISENHLRALNGPHVPGNFNYRAVLANPAAAMPVRYEYQGQARAVTMVHADSFGHRRPVGEAIIAERDRRQWAGQPVQIQAPAVAPQMNRREGDRREYDRRLESEQRTAEDRRQQFDRRRQTERPLEQSGPRPSENSVLPATGSGREFRQAPQPEAAPVSRPALVRPEADRQATLPRPESTRPPVSSAVVDRPGAETARPFPRRPERVEQRSAVVTPVPVTPRIERPAVEVRAAERPERHDVPQGRREMNVERPQPPRPTPAAPAAVSSPMPVERPVRPEAEGRGGRDRRDDRRGPGNPDRP